MTFVKGKSGNPRGPKKGPREATLRRREAVNRLLDKVLFDINTADRFQGLEFEKQMELIVKLMPYYIPKLEADSGTLEAAIKPFMQSLTDKLKESGAA